MLHLTRRALAPLASAAVLALAISGAHAEDKFITVQSTTSTEASGLYDYLLPIFTEKTGIDVRVVAVGTGQALKNAENCDGDVLVVHAKPAEEEFVEAGFGTERTDVMYNDFIIVGPSSDPAGISGSKNVREALAKIAEAQAPFASRADDSGTHKTEMVLWEAAGIDPTSASGSWYRETGSGMGETLNTAIGMDAYAMSDRATWINYGNKGDFEITVEGDEEMFNQYGAIPVSPDQCPNTKIEMAQEFADWLVSEEGQEAIAGFEVNGEQLFFPNAPRSEEG